MELKRGGGAISFPTNSTGASSARQREGKEEEERGGRIKRGETRLSRIAGARFWKSVRVFLTRNRGWNSVYAAAPTFFFLFFLQWIRRFESVRTYARGKIRIIRNIEFRISKNFFSSSSPSTNFISSLSHRLKRAFNYYNEIYPRAGWSLNVKKKKRKKNIG